MKRSFTLLFCFYFFTGFSQNVNPPNHFFTEASIRPCAFDSTQMMLQFDDWLIYQTLDDTWNGVMDSSLCIGVKDTLGKLVIKLNQIDVSKPVFVKSLMDDNTKVLLNSDWVYEGIAQIETSEDAFVNFSPNCNNGFCSGIIFGIEIPDSTGTTTDLRIFTDVALSSADKSYSTCVVTEGFDENYLKEIVFKYKFLGGIGNNTWFRPKIVDMETFDNYGINFIENDTIAYENYYNSSDSSYSLSIYNLVDYYDFFSSTYLILYHDSTYPSADYPSYLEINPEVNDTFQKTINLYFDNYYSFHFQPFVEFRGGFIEGSDSIRHHLNFVNNGNDMCFSYGFIELIFEDGDNYIHKGGTVEMKGQMACFRFETGSSLIVADDTHFDYGKSGQGILALATGGTIQLGKNSSINIDSKVWLYELEELRSENDNQQIFMNLNKGSELVFGKNASLDNKFSVDRNMKLNIYMNGGTLDISNLSAESREVLNLIYPTPPLSFSDNVEAFPNPANQEVNFSLIFENKEMVKISVFDLSGKIVFTQNEVGQKGKNYFPINIQNLNSGIYFFTIKTSLGITTKKIVVY